MYKGSQDPVANWVFTVPQLTIALRDCYPPYYENSYMLQTLNLITEQLLLHYEHCDPYIFLDWGSLFGVVQYCCR